MIQIKRSCLRILGLLILTGLVLSNVRAELKPGVAAPSFTASAALAGKPFTFSLTESLKKGPVVVYFYPKAFTHGCTIEANLFALAAEKFASMNATVIGVSGDGIQVLQEFSLGPCGSKFAVASDADKQIMKSYDAAMALMPGVADRISYVVSQDQKIYFAFQSMSPDLHVNNTLEAVERLHNANKK
jgi:peroxiredoxin